MESSERMIECLKIGVDDPSRGASSRGLAAAPLDKSIRFTRSSCLCRLSIFHSLKNTSAWICVLWKCSCVAWCVDDNNALLAIYDRMRNLCVGRKWSCWATQSLLHGDTTRSVLELERAFLCAAHEIQFVNENGHCC